MVLAADILAALASRGITAEAVAGRLKVTPTGALTEADRATIRRYRHALLVALVNPPITSGLCPNCWRQQSPCPPYGWCRACIEPGRADSPITASERMRHDKLQAVDR